MTQKNSVADEKLGILLRREQDMHRRILQGSLDIDFVLEELQRILEGRKNTLPILSSLSLSDRIALGKYDWVNDNITEKNFLDKAEKDYEVEYRVFHFNRSISSDSAIAEMEKEGFKPANILELLKLGEIEPNLQREFPIIALGSVWRNVNGGRGVPVLDYNISQRWLILGWSDHNWSADGRFLGVRNM